MDDNAVLKIPLSMVIRIPARDMVHTINIIVLSNVCTYYDEFV